MLQTESCTGSVTGAGGRHMRHRAETAVRTAEAGFTGVRVTGSDRRREAMRHDEPNARLTLGRS
jgi:hypothetical protein